MSERAYLQKTKSCVSVKACRLSLLIAVNFQLHFCVTAVNALIMQQHCSLTAAWLQDINIAGVCLAAVLLPPPPHHDPHHHLHPAAGGRVDRRRARRPLPRIRGGVSQLWHRHCDEHTIFDIQSLLVESSLQPFHTFKNLLRSLIDFWQMSTWKQRSIQFTFFTFSTRSILWTLWIHHRICVKIKVPFYEAAYVYPDTNTTQLSLAASGRTR